MADRVAVPVTGVSGSGSLKLKSAKNRAGS